MADSDLPVWSFRANWKEGVTERLEWLTDVIRAKEGAEQRRCLRDLPRRTLEADFLLRGPERTFYDLFINRLGGRTIMIPLYWDVQGLTARTVATTTTRLNFDNTYREFAPGLAIIMGKTALDYEVVSISSMDAGGVNLASATTRSWPVGSKLMPLRRGIIDDVGQPEHLAGGVATLSARLQITAPNEWTPPADPAPVYQDRPVFLDEPNWVESLTTSYDRETVRLDTTLGIPYQADPLGRALLGQSHRWFLPGRQKLAGFRDLLYRRKGRVGSFWLPTFKFDLRLVGSPGSAATQIEVENVGYRYTGGPTSGREYIAIKHEGGTILRKVLSVIPGTTSATEKLNLDAPLGLALSPGQVRRISFADVARFDQDDFEIQHHAGIDGLSECNARFRTFKATRSAPQPISFPIPLGIQNGLPCGVGYALNILGNDSGEDAVSATGLVINLLPGEYIVITKPPGLLYDAWSFTPVTPYGEYGSWNWRNTFYSTDAEGNNVRHWGTGDVNTTDGSMDFGDGQISYTSPELALAAVVNRTVILEGSNRYKLWIKDATVDDNRGGMSAVVEIRKH